MSAKDKDLRGEYWETMAKREGTWVNEELCGLLQVATLWESRMLLERAARLILSVLLEEAGRDKLEEAWLEAMHKVHHPYYLRWPSDVSAMCKAVLEKIRQKREPQAGTGSGPEDTSDEHLRRSGQTQSAGPALLEDDLYHPLGRPNLTSRHIYGYEGRDRSF